MDATAPLPASAPAPHTLPADLLDTLHESMASLLNVDELDIQDALSALPESFRSLGLCVDDVLPHAPMCLVNSHEYLV